MPTMSSTSVKRGGAWPLPTDGHQLALQYRLTSSFAAYLELAQRRNLPPATFDDELRPAAATAGVTVL